MRFSYGRVVPWVHRHEGRTVAVAGPDSVWFDTTAETYGEELTTYSDFTIAPGDRVAFTISWEPSHKQPRRCPSPSSPWRPPRTSGASGSSTVRTTAPTVRP